MPGLLTLDISPSWVGWCAWSAKGVEADAFLLPPFGADLGALALAFSDNACALIDRFDPDMASYEAPLLLKHDALLDLRRNYGLGMVFEELCAEITRTRANDGNSRALPCKEFNVRRAKNFITGDPNADKRDVAAKIEELGIKLPAKAAEGRLDAGDAAAGALLHLSEFDPAAASPWIAKLRGSLL